MFDIGIFKYKHKKALINNRLDIKHDIVQCGHTDL